MHFSEINTPSAGFQPGFRRIEITGTDGEVVNSCDPHAVEAQSNMVDRDRYVALLNGFDLEAPRGSESERPKSLDRLKLEVDDLDYVDGQLEFDICWTLKVDRDTDECGNNDDVTYDLLVKYVLVGGNSDELRYGNVNVDHDYDWDGPDGAVWQKLLANLGNFDEIFFRDERRHPTIPGDTAYLVKAVGFRGFNINLDTAHHMLEIRVRVRVRVRATNIDEDPVTGDVHFDLDLDRDLFFKNWTEGMKCVHPLALASYGSEGSATVSGDMTLLQFKQGFVNQHRVSGVVDTATGVVDTVEVTFEAP